MAYSILFIDDNDTLIRSLKAQLPDDDLHLTRVETGEDGKSKASEIHPDAVVLSVDIPNGFAACRSLKKDPTLQSIPLILVSELIDAGTFEKHSMLPTHGDAYLRTPLNGARLAETLETFLPLLGRNKEVMAASGSPLGRAHERERGEHLEALKQAIGALESSEIRVDELNKELTRERESRTKAEALSSQYLEAITQQGDSMKSLEERIVSLEGDVQIARSAEAAIQESFEKQNVAIEKERSDVAQMEVEMATKLESRSVSADRVAQQLSSVAQELEKAQKEANETSSQAEVLAGELASLRNSFYESTQNVESLTEMNRNLEEGIESKETEKAELLEKISIDRLTLTGAQTELAEFQNTLQGTLHELSAKKEECGDLEKTLVALTEQQESLRTELKSAQENLSEEKERHETELAQWEEAQNSHIERHNQLLRQDEKRAETMGLMEKTGREQQDAIASLQETEQKLTASLRDAQETGEELLTELTTRDESLASLQRELGSQTEALSVSQAASRDSQAKAEGLGRVLETVSVRLLQGSDAFQALSKECLAYVEPAVHEVTPSQEVEQDVAEAVEASEESTPPVNTGEPNQGIDDSDSPENTLPPIPEEALD